jgi:MATE family multidrug resistance protein
MRNAMIVSMLIYLALLLVLVPALGNHGLFLSLTLFMVIRALTLGYYYPGIVKAMDHKSQIEAGSIS